MATYTDHYNELEPPSDEEIKELMLQKAHELFALCDREQKGFINKRDMQRLQTELPLNADQLEAVFDSLDEDSNGFLTLEEFTDGFGSFIGLAPPMEKQESLNSSVGSERVYEHENPDLDDDEENFTDFVHTIGAGGVFEDIDVIKSLWSRIRRDEPELLGNFEDFLSRVTTELRRTHTDLVGMENAMRNKSVSHEEEVRKLYEEMENQIRLEKERIIAEEKAKERQLREELEQDLHNKEQEMLEFIAKQKEMEDKLHDLSSHGSETKQENDKLLKEKEDLEMMLIQCQRHLEESRDYINSLRQKHRDEKRERAISDDLDTLAALQVSEGIALERESLVKQLDLLRDMNKRLRDDRDERDMQGMGERSLHRDEGCNEDGGEEDKENVENHTTTNSSHKKLVKQGSVMSNYFNSRKGRLGSKGGRGSAPSSPRGQPVGSYGVSAMPDHESGNNSSPQRLFKVVFVGDSGVGKSSFIHRFCTNNFRSSFSATIGVDFQVKSLLVEGHIVALQLWDTAGQERFRSITKQYFRKADGVIIMYDVSSESTFKNVRQWMESVQEGTDDSVVKLLIGNKTDLCEDDDHRVVKTKDGAKLADVYGSLFYECSALNGSLVHESLAAMACLLREKEDREIEKAVNLTEDDVKKKKCC